MKAFVRDSYGGPEVLRLEVADERAPGPSEVVLDILENPEIGPFTKEDGEVIINAEGSRLV